MTLGEHAASYVETPLRLDHDNNLQWHDEADVVVVGYGGAGACAALQAKFDGADVLVFDRFDGGGATTLSGGIYYGGGTRFQREAGYEDSADEMYKYLKDEIGDAVEDRTLRRFCDESNANLEWLIEQGVGFGSRVYTGKRSYPPVGYNLYFSGNEVTYRYRDIAVPAPRGHRVTGTGYTGQELFDTLKKRADELGVRAQTHSRVSRLITDAQGRVIGVQVNRLSPGSEGWKKHRKLIQVVNLWKRFLEGPSVKAAADAREIESRYSETINVKARAGVILTTGSFAFNREMVGHYAPKFRNAMALGTISCDGSGIVLGQSVGGDIGRMDSVTAWRSISPPVEFVKSILVNKEGRRFVTEDAYVGRVGHEIAQQTEERAWIVVDKASYWASFKSTIPVKGESWIEFSGPLLKNLLTNTVKGATLEQLAVRCGIDPAGLAASVDEYNRGVAQGQDAFGKNTNYHRPIGDGPYYAIDMSMGSKKFLCPTIPMGGLRVDEDSGHVIDAQGRPIAGLFAAGRAAVGIPSGFYVSGSSIADCVFSGRRAGHYIAAELACAGQNEKVKTA